MKDRGEFQCQERIRGSNPKFFFPKKETRILMFGKGKKNYNLSKDTASIPRHTGIWAQFQCLQGSHKNSNVLTDKIRTPVVRRIRAELPMFGIIRARILKFGRIKAKFQALEG